MKELFWFTLFILGSIPIFTAAAIWAAPHMLWCLWSNRAEHIDHIFLLTDWWLDYCRHHADKDKR